MHITLVKKILADGSPCRKCGEVEQRLQDAGQMSRIDQVVTADERDPDSEGMQLARQYQVERAPFFIVRDDAGEEKIYTVYFRFLKEVLEQDSSEQEEIAELMDNNPDLDYL
jgi:hypothetical protein